MVDLYYFFIDGLRRIESKRVGDALVEMAFQNLAHKLLGEGEEKYQERIKISLKQKARS